MIKSIISKLRNTKSINRCSKCDIPESKNDIGDYYYLEKLRGRDFKDGCGVFAGGWQCNHCKYYEWVIPNDAEWLATQDVDTVLLDVWKVHNDKRVADEKEAHEKEMQEFELKLKTRLVEVDTAIKVFTDDKSFTVEELIEAGKLLIDELEERKTYITHILYWQSCVIGLNNQDRRLLRCWDHGEVDCEDG